MIVLVTGICGFAGSKISTELLNQIKNLQVIGIDNLSRKGSEQNISYLNHHDIKLICGDIRSQSDVDALPPVDWVIDCAANPSVLAGLDGQVSSRQVTEHNLLGTINLLEYCKMHRAGLILLSTWYLLINLIDLIIIWTSLPLFYYVVFCPYSLLIRLFGKSKLQGRTLPLSSYWKNVEQSKSNRRYIQQF